MLLHYSPGESNSSMEQDFLLIIYNHLAMKNVWVTKCNKISVDLCNEGSCSCGLNIVTNKMKSCLEFT